MAVARGHESEVPLKLALWNDMSLIRDNSVTTQNLWFFGKNF
jgi:hypothetical protein